MEHLALEIFDLADGKTSITALGSQYANLPKDASITITDTSEIFDSGDVWSHSFTLNIPANLHIFGTSGDIHGSRLHDQIDKRRARLWVEGLPLYLGYLRLSDEVEVDEDGNVDVTFESGQHTFDEMIDGAKANQVPMMSDVLIGLALWRKRWTSCGLRLRAAATFEDGSTSQWNEVVDSVERQGQPVNVINWGVDGESDTNAVQPYPRMVFPKLPEGSITSDDEDALTSVNCLNTDYAYDDGHPYCHVPLCYQKTDYKRTDKDGNETVDYSSEPEAQRGYEYMPANRVNSAPNFFVIYWLRALMKHLDIYIEENQMMEVEDLRRLFFVNTNCDYRVPKYMRTANPGDGFHRYRFSYTGRLCNRLVAEHYGELDGDEYNGRYKRLGLVNPEESGFKVKWSGNPTYDDKEISPADVPVISSVKVEVEDVEWWDEETKEAYETANSLLHEAYATSDCFPDVDISEIIEALESGFGIRLLFSDNYKRVRIVLLRNIFRSEDVQKIECDIIGEPTKTENSIRGFRMTYGDSDDTHFYYKGFADKMPHKKELWVDNSDTHDYSHWDLNADYAKIINKVSAFDKTCYVTPETGNAYGIKIDKDAKRYDELRPSLFEYAGFMDAEDGDCTGDEETIKTITIGFKPAVMNDLNMEQERKASTDEERRQRFALFVSEEMRPRRPVLVEGKEYNDSDALYPIYGKFGLYGENSPAKDMKADDGIVKPGEFAVTSDMYAWRDGLKTNLSRVVSSYGPITGQPGRENRVKWTLDLEIEGHINEGYRLYLQDNYKPDDDVCPIENHDWGLTLGVMRGSGNDAFVDYQPDPDDGEGNDTWEIQPGTSIASNPDTCDNYGNEWDYTASTVVKGGNFVPKMLELWPESNFDLVYSSGTTIRNETTYISSASLKAVQDYNGDTVYLLFATGLGVSGRSTLEGSEFATIDDYARTFKGVPKWDMKRSDAGRLNILVEVGSSDGRRNTLLEMQRKAFVPGQAGEIIIDDNGIGSRYGRFSLKLRAEKLNPYFDPTQEENDTTNRRYLEITDENLRRRGLCDQFYKEYSKFIREARIANLPVRMELAQLLAIDKTKRATVGDITGFIKKMQFTVSNKTGLGDVAMEMMYI